MPSKTIVALLLFRKKSKFTMLTQKRRVLALIFSQGKLFISVGKTKILLDLVVTFTKESENVLNSKIQNSHFHTLINYRAFHCPIKNVICLLFGPRRSLFTFKVYISLYLMKFKHVPLPAQHLGMCNI